MTVYVDDAKIGYGRMIMCHMIADTSDELFLMAASIGVPRKHIQYKGTYKEHFDICLSKRTLAVRYGAEELTTRELGLKLKERRTAKAVY